MDIISKLLKIAGKDNFQLDPAIGMSYVLRQCWKYGCMMIRGKIFSIGYGKISDSIFIGKKVKIIEKKRLVVGKRQNFKIVFILMHFLMRV